MDVLIFCIVGFIIGLIFSYLIVKHYTIGNLRLDNSDPEEEPYMFLELDSSLHNVNWIGKQKFVVLKVLLKNYISQK